MRNRTSRIDLLQRQDVVAVAIIYTALITACAKGGQPEQAFEILKFMHQQGVVPNVITYAALVSACEKDARPERASETLELIH